MNFKVKTSNKLFIKYKMQLVYVTFIFEILSNQHNFRFRIIYMPYQLFGMF